MAVRGGSRRRHPAGGGTLSDTPVREWASSSVRVTNPGSHGGGTQLKAKKLHLFKGIAVRDTMLQRCTDIASPRPFISLRDRWIGLVGSGSETGFGRGRRQPESLSGRGGVTLSLEKEHTTAALSCTYPSEPQGGTVFTDVRRHPFRQRTAFTPSLPQTARLCGAQVSAHGEESIARNE